MFRRNIISLILYCISSLSRRWVILFSFFEDEWCYRRRLCIHWHAQSIAGSVRQRQRLGSISYPKEPSLSYGIFYLFIYNFTSNFIYFIFFSCCSCFNLNVLRWFHIIYILGNDHLIFLFLDFFFIRVLYCSVSYDPRKRNSVLGEEAFYY